MENSDEVEYCDECGGECDGVHSNRVPTLDDRVGATPSALLYIGAGWDAGPLTFPAMRAAYTSFVFVDALPSVPHYTLGQVGYPKCDTEEALMASVTRAVARAMGADPGPPTRVSTNHYLFALPGLPLHYFTNTRDTAMASEPALAALLPQVTTLFCRGYSPAAAAYDALPNLRGVLAPLFILSSVPASHSDKLLPPLAESEEDQEGDTFYFTGCGECNREYLLEPL